MRRRIEETFKPIVPETEFVPAFDRYSADARREMVTVTRQGHVVGAFLSPDDLNHFERLKRREREALNDFGIFSLSSTLSKLLCDHRKL